MFLAIAFTLALSLGASVPFSFEANHLVIPITIDGTPTYALFDTGAGNVLDRQFAARLGLRQFGHDVAAGAGNGTANATRTIVRSLQFGSFTMRDQEFAVIPLPGALTHGNGFTVGAIVGREILEQYVTRIDYDTQALTFTPAATFRYTGIGISVPLQLRTGQAIVRGSIDGLPASFQIDTGSSASLVLTSPFVDANNLREKYPIAGNVVIGRGIGGYSRADLTRGRRLRVGNFEIDDMVIDLSTDVHGAFASHWVDGNIGNDVLQRVNMTLDYKRHAIYLEPNSRTAVPTPANRVGMYVQNDDRAFFDVVDVLPNGPAYNAGIRAGDRITFVDGMPAREVTENAFWQLMLETAGSMHTFSVVHDGEVSDVSVTLRDTV